MDTGMPKRGTYASSLLLDRQCFCCVGQDQPSSNSARSTTQEKSSEQKEPNPAKQQAPKTAPQVEEVLPAYEGQTVRHRSSRQARLDESHLFLFRPAQRRTLLEK